VRLLRRGCLSRKQGELCLVLRGIGVAHVPEGIGRHLQRPALLLDRPPRNQRLSQYVLMGRVLVVPRFIELSRSRARENDNRILQLIAIHTECNVLRYTDKVPLLLAVLPARRRSTDVQ
jgi:hypothetical protein